jgi:hypothetical protein
MITKDKFYGHPMFFDIIEELKQLHSEKNRQYATTDEPLSNFKRCGNMTSKLFKPDINKALAVCLSYMGKQVDGVIEIVGENKKGTIESFEDKLRDIAVYAIIAMIINRESSTEI